MHYLDKDIVSIHVPARGTTVIFINQIRDKMFQSTFPHGERQIKLSSIKNEIKFQSTFPHGERLEKPRKSRLLTDVSIHVPARGTTSNGNKKELIVVSFNPRSRTGNDPFVGCSLYFIACFNPRSRTGNDFIRQDIRREKQVSIHVPARGTTIIKQNDDCLCRLFQSSFPHGERHRMEIKKN